MALLILRRLTIINETIVSYDELFHDGVNIIRGENGVGKSTIANAIYFLLGGDFTKWLPEIQNCTHVYGEVELNEKIFSIRREIDTASMRPMEIYFGDLEKGLKQTIHWIKYPYKRSSSTDSFSQVLFKALDFPEVETIEDDYITFNQTLRLMYIDQISPLQELMKDVEFDSPLIRKTLADLLFGVYDNSLFNDQLRLKSLKKRFQQSESETKILKSVYASNSYSLDLNKIIDDIQQEKERLIKINNQIDRPLEYKSHTPKRTSQLLQLQSRISNESQNITKLSEEIQMIEYDTVDTINFVEELNRQLSSIRESKVVRDVLGELDIAYCPSCLTTLTNISNNSHCKLCKEELNEDESKSKLFRIEQQLVAQIDESNSLIEENNIQRDKLNAHIIKTKSLLNIQQGELNKLVLRPDSEANNKFDNLLIEKGKILEKINTLEDSKIAANNFSNQVKSIYTLKSQIESLEESINNKQNRQTSNYSLAISAINKYAKILLAGDGDYEGVFKTANIIQIDFSRNTYAVDGRNNFSASSLVILKNSVRFGIFFASIKLAFMRYLNLF